MPYRVTRGCTRFGQEVEAGVRGKPSPQGKKRQGRVNALGLGSLNNSSGLWGIGAVSSCLVPGPG